MSLATTCLFFSSHLAEEYMDIFVGSIPTALYEGQSTSNDDQVSATKQKFVKQFSNIKLDGDIKGEMVNYAFCAA